MLAACQNLFSGLRRIHGSAGVRHKTGTRSTPFDLRHPPGHAQRTLAYFMSLGHYDAQIRRL